MSGLLREAVGGLSGRGWGYSRCSGNVTGPFPALLARLHLTSGPGVARREGIGFIRRNHSPKGGRPWDERGTRLVRGPRADIGIPLPEPDPYPLSSGTPATCLPRSQVPGSPACGRMLFFCFSRFPSRVDTRLQTPSRMRPSSP